jgi:predicted lipoprotein with Yx(FWY)xxD motif
MSRSVTSNPNRRRAARVSLLVAAVAVALAALIGPATASQRPGAVSKAGRTQTVTRTVAKKADNATLGETVLISLKNRTLYTLSDEVHGKFFCTASCTSLWPPLIIGKNVKPRGPAPLGRVMRPDGRFQATFKGRPLYTYSGDSKAGQANGEGLILGKGTWHAASLGKISSRPPESPPPPPNPYPY